MLKCSAIINEYYYVCREEIRVQSGKEKYGLTRDEAAAICMYTYYSKSITNILVQGNPGLYGCYMDHFINGFLKMWNYNRYHNVPKVEILYTGINIKIMALLMEQNVYLKLEILLHSHHLAQQLLNIVLLYLSHNNSQEEALYSI